MPVKLKPSPAGSPQPAFSWDTVYASPSPQAKSDVAPPTQWLSALDMKTFGDRPLAQEVGVSKCNGCGKPVLQSAMADHAGTFVYGFLLCVYARVERVLTDRELC